MTHLALQLYEYNVWANKQICNRLKELPKEVYRQEVQSVFSSISNALAHIYLSDLGWIEVFSGKSMNHALVLAEQLKEQTELKGIEEMEIMFCELAEHYKSFLNQKENIDKSLVIEHPSGDLMKTSVSDLVLHVVESWNISSWQYHSYVTTNRLHFYHDRLWFLFIFKNKGKVTED